MSTHHTDTFYKVAKKSDGKFYLSYPFGGAKWVENGGDLDMNYKTSENSKNYLERNLDYLKKGDLEVVEFTLVEVQKEKTENGTLKIKQIR